MENDLTAKKELKLKCDTCGKIVTSVARVVIEDTYDRSMAKALYNCPECFAKKEQQRKQKE